MCEFLQDNPIIWDIKQMYYRKVDKKHKLWEEQAIVTGREVKNLQVWFKSLKDINTWLHKKRLAMVHEN